VRRAIVAVAALACAGAACAGLFDEPSQCKSDRDCAKFGEGVACDVTHAVCVMRGTPGDASLDASPPPPPPPPPDAGADAPVDERCLAASKPRETVTGAAVATDTTLDCTKDWVLPERLFVQKGVTLTIQPRTKLLLEKDAGIVVLPGARIVAEGERDGPIVITSNEATPAPGDHRGVVVLGNAPRAGTAPFDDDPAQPYGGASPDDDSGSLRYVRIEYGTYGLALAGVGRKTKVDFVEARRLTDNCFTFQGGTADAKHLVCQYPGDEIIEFNDGYAGRTQFVFGQKTPLGTANHHGVLADGSFPVVYNLTACGDSRSNMGYGLVVRNATRLDMANAILAGWSGGVDAVGALGTPLEARGSIAFMNTGNPAYAESAAVADAASPLFNDDNGFDEIAWWNDPARGNSTADPGLAACFDAVMPKPWAAAALTTNARTPPNDGFFDATAAFIGAFRDPTDTWMTGAWLRFATE
jgi:hypothetical protein